MPPPDPLGDSEPVSWRIEAGIIMLIINKKCGRTYCSTDTLMMNVLGFKKIFYAYKKAIPEMF